MCLYLLTVLTVQYNYTLERNIAVLNGLKSKVLQSGPLVSSQTDVPYARITTIKSRVVLPFCQMVSNSD